MLKYFFIFSLFISIAARAEKTELNKILFTAAGQSWTLRDLQVFEAVLNEVYKKKRLSQFSKSTYNDFLLSRLTQKEASTFDLGVDKVNGVAADKKKLSAFEDDEVKREIEYIAKAQAFIELKEAQHKDATRFNNWFELMKRKFNVKIKSFDAAKTQ